MWYYCCSTYLLLIRSLERFVFNLYDKSNIGSVFSWILSIVGHMSCILCVMIVLVVTRKSAHMCFIVMSLFRVSTLTYKVSNLSFQIFAFVLWIFILILNFLLVLKTQSQLTVATILFLLIVSLFRDWVNLNDLMSFLCFSIDLFSSRIFCGFTYLLSNNFENNCWKY